MQLLSNHGRAGRQAGRQDFNIGPPWSPLGLPLGQGVIVISRSMGKLDFFITHLHIPHCAASGCSAFIGNAGSSGIEVYSTVLVQCCGSIIIIVVTMPTIDQNQLLLATAWRSVE